ncbi:MAG: pilus assembly protein PilM, partial [Ignavibacteriales bacterium]|nr:pilus assembly protein PilM [Ignavibacteriales bacterium]
MKSTRHLGVSFCNGSIQLAEIEQGRKIVVTSLAERESSIDLVQAGIHLSAEHPQVATLAGELGEMIKRNKIATRSVSYALPADPVFINIIPLPTSLQGPALNDFLLWEIHQYFPDAGPKDFIIDSHPLPSRMDVKPAFVVGVRRGMVTFLQKVTSDLRMQLQLIDVDHLSTEKTISFNYPEIRDHAVGLFSLGMTGIIASIVRNGEIVHYRTYKGDIPGDVPKTINAYLKHIK